MTPDPAATMRQRYGEREGKTCGECDGYIFCELRNQVEGDIEMKPGDAACGKFETKEVEK